MPKTIDVSVLTLKSNLVKANPRAIASRSC